MDGSPKPAAKRERRIRLPIRKRKAVAAQKKNETKKRRRNKRWSLREEDILRTAVESYVLLFLFMKYCLLVHTQVLQVIIGRYRLV